MSAGKAARAATLSRVFAWVGLVLALAAACSSAGPGDGADAVALDTTVPDSAAQVLTEAECVAKNGECVKATWTATGVCEVEVKSGGWCGTGTSVCRGTCSAAGTCVGPGPELHCGSLASPCFLCDGKGHCGINTSGAQCTPITLAGGCFEQAGTCDSSGACQLVAVSGKTCVAHPGPCGAGICDANGYCRPASEGQPCKGATGTCRKYQGTCDADGECVGAADTGAECTTSTKQACRKSTGVCGPNGECEGDIDEGAACTSGTSPCGAICTAAGTCVAVSPGTPCASAGTDCPKLCTQAGSCSVSVGADCTVKNGACAGKPGVCSTNGFCLGVDDCAKPWIAVPTGEFAKGLSCVKITGNIPAMPPANSGTCGNDGDPCRPKFCKTLDSDATFTCKVGQLNDGTPCPGDAANPCAASTCQAGKCTPAFKPVGTSCKPLAPALCAEFQCSSAGKCEPVPASVPLAAPCTVSDGDTDCWAKSCDGQGNCTEVPRAKGEHCGAELDNACAKFACDGKGRCLVELVATNGQCKDAKCLDFYAKPGTPCTGGPCTDNGCTSLGICATTYKPVGAPCELSGYNYGYPGTCDENHVCIWPAKVIGAIVGTSCYGTFPCMKEDVAYGADGVCHGTVAVGEACGSLCNPGICGADGTCQQAFAPKGLACGGTSQCGAMACDGKGGCMDTPVPGKPCPSGNECELGACNEYGNCVGTKLTGNSCKLGAGKECLKGVCANGFCGTPTPGEACGKDTACMTYSCSAAGQCAGTPKTGASCESTEMCKVGVCDAAGQCKQVLAPGAKCVSSKQCMEGTCNASGGCDSSPKPPGIQCTATAPGTDWSCYTGACDGKGGCELKVNPGAKCKQGDGPCTEGICQSDASCKAVPAKLGKACSALCVAAGVCDAQGTCSGKAATGEPCSTACISAGQCTDTAKCIGTVKTGAKCGPGSYFAICQENTCDSDGGCTTKNAPAGNACAVGVTFSNLLPSYACGSSAGICNGAGTCVSSKPDPDGTACGYDDGCAAAHVCKGGLCVPEEPKANLSPCKFGCAVGHCMAGGCFAPTNYNPDNGICNDGSICTLDFCTGSPLSVIGSYLGFGDAISPGKCDGTIDWWVCPKGTPPPQPKCKDSDCGKDGCGLQTYCLFSYDDQEGTCGLEYNKMETYSGENQNACDDKNPCTKDGCSNGYCVDTPINNGTSCAPFKQCQGGKCVSWN